MAARNQGTVVQVIGPVLDIRFAEGSMPELLNAIEVEHNGNKVVAEVAQHIGDDVVRCIAMSSTDGLALLPRGLRPRSFGKTPAGAPQKKNNR